MAKENKKVCSGQEVLTYALEVSTHEDSVQRIDSGIEGVGTWPWGADI